ncbi:DUF4349 domain-containing protein [Paenibacillus macerans]|uniref:DUF4349 domain-containing protein n=1 Tax=Paenibacillus macerans TaxID=44252 RepID=UPI003D31A500
MEKWRRKVAAFSVIVLFALLLGGCGSASNNAASDSAAGNGAAETADMAVQSLESESKMDGGGEESSKGSAEAPAEGTGAQDPAAGNAGNVAKDTTTGVGSSFTDAGINKKLIYRANVVMEVKDYSKAQSEIRNLVTLTGGYIVEFSENQSQHELGGTFVLKVPSAGFSSFLDRLEKLQPETMQRSMQGQDVSEEYVDLESRLKVKQAMEARYLKFVEEATQTKQLVEFVGELERIQTEIEQIKGRMRYIDSNVAYSTIEIRVYQPDPSKLTVANDGETPLLERIKNALAGSIDVLSLLVQWLIVFLAGALPVLIIAAIIVVPIWLVRRKNKAERDRRRPRLQPPTLQAAEATGDETRQAADEVDTNGKSE